MTYKPVPLRLPSIDVAIVARSLGSMPLAKELAVPSWRVIGL